MKQHYICSMYLNPGKFSSSIIRFNIEQRVHKYVNKQEHSGQAVFLALLWMLDLCGEKPWRNAAYVGNPDDDPLCFNIRGEEDNYLCEFFGRWEPYREEKDDGE